MRDLKQAMSVVAPLCQLIETDLRLHIHSVRGVGERREREARERGERETTGYEPLERDNRSRALGAKLH